MKGKRETGEKGNKGGMHEERDVVYVHKIKEKFNHFPLFTGLLVVMLFIDRIGRIKTLVVGFGCTAILFALLMLCNGV